MSPRAEEALLSFQLSRWATRTGPEGKLLTLDLQDRGQWDRELIADGGGLSFACPRRAARPVAAAGRARHLPRHRAVLRGHGIAEWGRRSRAFAEQLPVKKPKQQKG